MQTILLKQYLNSDYEQFKTKHFANTNQLQINIKTIKNQ